MCQQCAATHLAEGTGQLRPYSKRSFNLETTILGEILSEEMKDRMDKTQRSRHNDPISQLNLWRVSRKHGIKLLESLQRAKNLDMKFEGSKTGKGAIWILQKNKNGNYIKRARWVPTAGGEPCHWSKIEPYGKHDKDFLTNRGKPVEGSDRSHRIPSDCGSPGMSDGQLKPVPRQQRKRREFEGFF